MKLKALLSLFSCLEIRYNKLDWQIRLKRSI